jgi:hypothetical protein
VAFEAGVPIIPVFTENIREAFVNLQTGGWFWRLIYRYINPNLHFQSTYLHIR